MGVDNSDRDLLIDEVGENVDKKKVYDRLEMFKELAARKRSKKREGYQSFTDVIQYEFIPMIKLKLGEEIGPDPDLRIDGVKALMDSEAHPIYDFRGWNDDELHLLSRVVELFAVSEISDDHEIINGVTGEIEGRANDVLDKS